MVSISHASNLSGERGVTGRGGHRKPMPDLIPSGRSLLAPLSPWSCTGNRAGPNLRNSTAGREAYEGVSDLKSPVPSEVSWSDSESKNEALASLVAVMLVPVHRNLCVGARAHAHAHALTTPMSQSNAILKGKLIYFGVLARNTSMTKV